MPIAPPLPTAIAALSELAAQFELEGRSLTIGASIGIAPGQAGGEAGEMLLRHADDPAPLYRVAVRCGVDRETLKRTYRVMQHTSFRARQVRDAMVQRASTLLLEYVDAMGGHEHCEPEVLDVHFQAISRLLACSPATIDEAEAVVAGLEALFAQKIARRRAA